jgi:AcrR family transcriptional regulator
MSTIPSPLSARHADLTQRIILGAAIDLLETGAVHELSVRAVARQAEISERTVFRYFASREDLLDAVLAEVRRRMRPPPNPSTVAELLAFPKAIYTRFEETSALTHAMLQSELYPRIMGSGGDGRSQAIRDIVDRAAPDRSERERRLVAADIQHHVVASTWRYYRIHFGFSLRDAIECARLAIERALTGLGIDVPAATKRD